MNENLLDPEWQTQLSEEFQKPYWADLKNFLKKEQDAKKTLYPEKSRIFEAFKLTPFSQVKIVILGQDPYHGPGQAHGLCFSVQDGIKHPPSLRNIFKELHADLGVPIPKSGCLSHWAKQGVLLLNTVLTVEAGQAASHQGRGWEKFTDAVIYKLDQSPQPILFLLWGAFAQSKAPLIQSSAHQILKTAHPSPLSARHGWFGSNHFSKANQILQARGAPPIQWSET